jgi:hypothetical protein
MKFVQPVPDGKALNGKAVQDLTVQDGKTLDNDFAAFSLSPLTIAKLFYHESVSMYKSTKRHMFESFGIV